MKKWLYLIVFIVGVGISFWGTAYFSDKKTDSAYDRISSIGGRCSAPCCLPDDIKLSAAQKDQVRKLGGSYCQCRDGLSLQIDQKRVALADMLLQPKPDVSTIDKLLGDIAKLQMDLEKKTIEHILTIKDHLEPQQQERFIVPIVKEIRRRCQHQGCVQRHQ